MKSLSETLKNATNHTPPEVQAYAPKPKPHHTTVEEELREVVEKVELNNDPAATASIVEDHFIQQGEAIARAMEERVTFHEERAKEYYKLAANAREAAKVQAASAAKHEERMKQMQNLVTLQEKEGG